MSFISKMKSLPAHLPHGTAKRGLMGVAVDKGERYGAAFGYGALKGYLGERFIYKGHGIDLLSGVGLTVASALLNAFSNGRSELADHAERIGDAGIMSALNSLGASYGSNKAGRVVQVLNPGKNASGKLPGAKQTMLGYIAPAMGGAYLTADQIANFAAKR